MSKILKNVTISNITIVDVGITILANDDHTINPTDYLHFAQSNDLIGFIGSGDIVVNDGSDDLSISDGVDLIKGIFPKRIGIVSGDDYTNIGHVSDSVKAHITNLPATQNVAITSSVELELKNDTGNPLPITPINHAPNLTTTGSLTALNSTVSTSVLNGFGTAGIIITGTWVGTITFQGSIDGTNYVTMNAVPIGTGLITQAITSNNSLRINITGLKSIRVIMSSYTSGTANITIELTVDAGFIRTLTNLIGSTNGTQIGNVGDRLKVDASVVLAGGATQSYTNKLKYDDMNASTGTLARGASVTAVSGWNKIYGYNGSGLLSGVVISLETKDDWAIRIVVDGEEIFGTGTGNGILSTDLHTDSIYDADTSGRSVPELDQDLGVFWGAHDRFQWVGPLLIPITFGSSVDVYIRRSVGSATKKFQAGYVVIEKRT